MVLGHDQQKLTAISWTLILSLLVTTCRFSATPLPNPTALPTTSVGEADAHGANVVLVALDGARPDWIASYIENGIMPNLAALAKRGVTAEYMQTVDPALATPAYFSLSTGVFPNRTGQVSDKYYVPQQAFHEQATPVAQSVAAVEPIWRTAMRNGLRTAALFWPSAMPDVAGWQADYTVAIVSSDIPSAQHVITLAEALDWQFPPHSFSPLLEGVLRVASREDSSVATFNALAVDSTDDNSTNYDLLLLDSDKDLSNDYTTLRLDKWAAVSISPRLHSGAYFCFTASGNVTANVYTSQINYNQARPDSLLRALNDKFGFPPPVPDFEALRGGWLSAKQCYEMAEIRARWMTDVVLYVYRTFQPNLLLTAQTIIAECARPFLLVDERQEGYTPEQAAQYAPYLQKAHKVADENLGRLLELVNLADSAVLVLSTHSLMPVHTTVRLNTILKNAGLLQLKTIGGRDEVDERKSKALAFASGGSAHIYINLQDRQQSGLVAPDDFEKVRKQIIQALEETKDQDGQPVFARILRHDEYKPLHLESPNSGDVFVQAASGYSLSDELGFKKVLAAAPDRAAGGFDAMLPEMHAIFIAAGDNLLSGKTIPPMFIVDVAPTIAKALRLKLPDTLDGHAIEDIWW